MKEVDVLIVGAGPTGLTLALDLARRNINFRIIDKALLPPTSSRAKGLRPRSLEVFDNLGIAGKIMEAGSTDMIFRWMEKDKVLKETAMRSLTTARADTVFPYGVMIAQWRLEQILRDVLAEEGEEVHYGNELLEFNQNSEGVLATLTGIETTEQLRCKYMVACDGGKSFVRKALDINFEGTTYESFSALIGDVEVEGLVPDAWHMWRHPDYGIGMSLCPLPGTNTWQIQVPAIPGTDGRLPSPNLETFRSLFYESTGITTVTLNNITWGTNYRVNERVAEKFRVGNVFIAGDAAHVHSIAGGLGMNTGIQDAFNLGWKLAAVLKGPAPTALLDSYEQERLPIAEWTIKNSHESAKRVYQSSLKGTGGIEQGVNDDGTQLNLNYRNSVLSSEHLITNTALHAGDRAPDGIYQTATGTPARLFDWLRGARFAILAIGLNNIAVLEAIQPQFPALVIMNILNTDGIATQHDHISALYGPGPVIYIIRPDGYIGLISDGRDVKAIFNYLAGLVIPKA